MPLGFKTLHVYKLQGKQFYIVIETALANDEYDILKNWKTLKKNIQRSSVLKIRHVNSVF